MTIDIKSHAKVGVYVDAANISRNGGQRMQYDILREFACRDHAEPLRLNVYLSHDEERAETNTVYRDKARAYQSALRELGYKVIEKRVKWFQDEAGNRYGKANADLDMAVDVLLQSENLDRVLAGDRRRRFRSGGSAPCRTRAAGLRCWPSTTCRRSCAGSGHVRPAIWYRVYCRLVATITPRPWGRWVRGFAVTAIITTTIKSFGFMRFLVKLSQYLWKTDSRDPDSPYRTAFFMTPACRKVSTS